MKLSQIVTPAAIAFVLFTGAAMAQTTTRPAPAATTSSAAGTKMDKTAVSKACSQQADAQNLHGKARKQFRSKCKMGGGKTG
jgi:hypothetical protein